MGFADQLKKLIQPIDDEGDFFEGADESAMPAAKPTQAQLDFENAFAGSFAPAPEQPAAEPARPQGNNSSVFVSMPKKERKPRPQPRERLVNFGGSETQVILFNPKSFDEAGELMNHLLANRSVVMTLEGIDNDMARRFLDFLSGITFALQGKITPVSAKTYFVTPHNVDLLGSQPEQPESDGQYF